MKFTTGLKKLLLPSLIFSCSAHDHLLTTKAAMLQTHTHTCVPQFFLFDWKIRTQAKKANPSEAAGEKKSLPQTTAMVLSCTCCPCAWDTTTDPPASCTCPSCRFSTARRSPASTPVDPCVRSKQTICCVERMEKVPPKNRDLRMALRVFLHTL